MAELPGTLSVEPAKTMSFDTKGAENGPVDANTAPGTAAGDGGGGGGGGGEVEMEKIPVDDPKDTEILRAIRQLIDDDIKDHGAKHAKAALANPLGACGGLWCFVGARVHSLPGFESIRQEPFTRIAVMWTNITRPFEKDELKKAKAKNIDYNWRHEDLPRRPERLDRQPHRRVRQRHVYVELEMPSP